MNNIATKAQDLTIAIHVLQSTGQIPAFYRLPKKQRELEKAFMKELQKALDGLGSVLLSKVHMQDRLASPENLFGYFEADVWRRATSIEEAYQTHLGLGMEFGYLRGGKEVSELVGVTLDFNLKNPAVQQILRERTFVASEATMSRMLGDVETILRRGYERGLGGDKIANLLDMKFHEMKRQRLEMISRTEIGSAQNEGAMKSYEDAEITHVQWLAAHDERTRYSHLLEHGKKVRRGEKFPVTQLRYPGDKQGDISEWVNCRCAVRAVVNTPKERKVR